MKKMFGLLFVLVLILVTLLVGCGGSSPTPGPTATSTPGPTATPTPGPTPTPISTLFTDHFEYTVASPWANTNGWINSTNYNIVGGGVSGNALEWHGSGLNALMNNYTNSDYQVSVRIKPVNITVGNWPIYVFARAQDTDNWYGAGIWEDGTDSFLILRKCVGGSTMQISSVTFKHGSFDPSIYYTLTLTVEGTTITAVCSGGGVSQTTTGTDATYANGKVGIVVWDNVDLSKRILFDDFTVSSL